MNGFRADSTAVHSLCESGKKSRKDFFSRVCLRARDDLNKEIKILYLILDILRNFHVVKRAKWIVYFTATLHMQSISCFRVVFIRFLFNFFFVRLFFCCLVDTFTIRGHGWNASLKCHIAQPNASTSKCNVKNTPARSAFRCPYSCHCGEIFVPVNGYIFGILWNVHCVCERELWV